MNEKKKVTINQTKINIKMKNKRKRIQQPKEKKLKKLLKQVNDRKRKQKEENMDPPFFVLKHYLPFAFLGGARLLVDEMIGIGVTAPEADVLAAADDSSKFPSPSWYISSIPLTF